MVVVLYVVFHFFIPATKKAREGPDRTLP